MELQESGYFVAHLAVFYLLRIQSEGRQRLGNRNSVCIFGRQEIGIDAPNQCAAADEGEVETYTLFFREADQVDGEWQPFSVQRLDQGQSHHYAQHAVEGTAVGHCVQMRTDHQRGVRGAGISAAEIAGGIDCDLHACGFHPPLDRLHAIAHCRGEESALDLARLFA